MDTFVTVYALSLLICFSLIDWSAAGKNGYLKSKWLFLLSVTPGVNSFIAGVSLFIMVCS